MKQIFPEIYAQVVYILLLIVSFHSNLVADDNFVTTSIIPSQCFYQTGQIGVGPRTNFPQIGKNHME